MTGQNSLCHEIQKLKYLEINLNREMQDFYTNTTLKERQDFYTNNIVEIKDLKKWKDTLYS